MARQRPPETFYVLAFLDGYAEEEGPIYPPTVAMNSIEAVRDMHPAADEHDFWGERWNPADWRWPELPVGGRALAARYTNITKLAGAGSVADWRRIDARQAARGRRGGGGAGATRAPRRRRIRGAAAHG